MDISTLIFALALGNLSLCCALFFAEYERHKTLTVSLWAVAKQCQAAAWLLMYFRGIVPDLLSIPLANALLFCGVALDAAALWELAGRVHWRRYLLAPLALAIAASLGCYLLDVAQGARTALGSLIVAGFLLAGVAALLPDWPRGSMLCRFLIVGTAVLALAVGARGLLAALRPDGWAWMSGDLLRALAFGALYLAMLVNGFCYLLLSRERLQQDLARLEVVDALTGVLNRRGFYNALAQWMALARRPGMSTALVLLNLDHFKRINDSYGHAVGDVVLKAMVEVCAGQLRDSDLIGRLGGAEFAILLPRTALEAALQVAERLRGAVAEMPVKAERAVINLTASLGVTTLRAEDSAISLFQRADEALQAARQAGRNRVAEAAPAGLLDA